jgi:hypothetical protein
MIMTEHDPIPDDLPTCQKLLRTLLMRLRDLERQLDEFVATTEEMQRTYACKKEEHLALQRMLFGPRRERLPEAPGQQQYEPGKMWVLRHIYPKYACSCGKDGVTSAERAASPIERGLAGPGLLAYVIVNKFSDCLRSEPPGGNAAVHRGRPAGDR